MDSNLKQKKQGSSPWKLFLQLLYPNKCGVCRCILPGNQDILCPECRLLLAQSRLAIPWQTPDGMTVASAFYYEEPLRGAFLRYKFQGMDFYGPMLGGYVADAAKRQLVGEFDLVTWAPLSKKRLRQREYDQAKIFAGAVAQALGIPLVATLEKVRHTKTQSSLDGVQRWENTRDAYGLLAGADVEGKRILLVDDITTTGSTLSACAQVLKQHGAVAIAGATLARHRD